MNLLPLRRRGGLVRDPFWPRLNSTPPATWKRPALPKRLSLRRSRSVLGGLRRTQTNPADGKAHRTLDQVLALEDARRPPAPVILTSGLAGHPRSPSIATLPPSLKRKSFGPSRPEQIIPERLGTRTAARCCAARFMTSTRSRTNSAVENRKSTPAKLRSADRRDGSGKSPRPISRPLPTWRADRAKTKFRRQPAATIPEGKVTEPDSTRRAPKARRTTASCPVPSAAFQPDGKAQQAVLFGYGVATNTTMSFNQMERRLRPVFFAQLTASNAAQHQPPPAIVFHGLAAGGA